MCSKTSKFDIKHEMIRGFICWDVRKGWKGNKKQTIKTPYACMEIKLIIVLASTVTENPVLSDMKDQTKLQVLIHNE